MSRTKSLWSVLLIGLLFSTYIQSQEVDGISRNSLIDDNWKFQLSDNKESANPGFDDTGWTTLSLPHDWSIQGSFDIDAPAGNDGGYLPTGTGWYRKNLEIPSSYQGKRFSLYFEGVYMNAEVYVNGQKAGFHLYGYTSFSVDITPYVQLGKDNTVAVRVDNSRQKNCRWYSGSGIYRHVRLQVYDPVHVSHWGIAVTTPRVTEQQALVAVNTEIQNETSQPQTRIVKVTIRDALGKKKAEKEMPILLSANEKKIISHELLVNTPELWDIDNPYLYKAEITVLENGRTKDIVYQPFGIRTVEYSAQGGLTLNGKPIKLNGGCVHHDNGCLGAAAFDRAEERRVQLLKEAGFNAVRTSHNPPSEAFLDACDRLGMLVIDEAFDGWKASKNTYDYSVLFDEYWKEDLSALVLRDRNHPSVFCWSIGNEVIERKSPEAVNIAHNMVTLCHQIDPTRPVTSAMTTWDRDWQVFDPLMAEHDICGYNYQINRASSDHQRVPSRVIIQTESYPRDAFSNWALVNDNPYILGDFVWTAIDYIGESSIGRYYYKGEVEGEHYQGIIYPWHGAYCGDIDLLGQRKPISYYREMLYADSDDYLYLAIKEPSGYFGEIKTTGWSVWPTWESWTWPGHEGKTIEAEIYSRYPKVRLYLNDQLISEQPTGRDQAFKATIKLPYQPGVLKAVAVDAEGREKETRVLSTAGAVSQMSITADVQVLKADGQDLAFVIVELVDRNGQRDPNASNPILFEIEGQGEIIATDNGSIKDETPYISLQRKAWKGRAMAVVRTTTQGGKIVVRAKSAGLPDATVVLKSK